MLKTYQLASGTSLFKGDTAEFLEYEKTGNLPTLTSDVEKPVFFSLIHAVAETYGVTFQYKTTRAYTLLEIDDIDTMQTVYENSPENIQIILKKNYGYDAANNRFTKRNSVYDADKTLSTYLCNQGYDGYILTGKMATDFEGSFHAELAICHDQDGVKCENMVTAEENIQALVDKYKDKKNNPSRKGKKSPQSQATDEEAEARFQSMLLTKASTKASTTSPTKSTTPNSYSYSYSSPQKKQRYGGLSRKQQQRHRRKNSARKTKRRLNIRR